MHPTYSQQQSWPVYQQPFYGTPYPVRRTAPASVHVVAVIQYIGGLLALVGAGLAGFAGFMARREPSRPNIDVMTPEGAALLFWIAGGFLLVSGLIAVLLGRKLQRGRQWARVVLIVLNMLSVASAGYFFVESEFAPSHLASAVLPVLCLFLLNTRAARSWFRSRTY